MTLMSKNYIKVGEDKLNELIDIKTNMPKNDSNLVIRKRLFNIIDKKINDQSRFMLISAPAGYGKTTLISQWLKEKNYNKAWLSSSEADSDIGYFFYGIIAALEKINGTDFTGLKEIINMSTWPDLESLISTFIDDIITIQDNFMLVIDNYHLINNQFIHDFIEKLIMYIPNNMYLIILTREDPPFNLNRYKLNGQMNEIRIDDLRFKLNETIDLYNKYLGLKIDKSYIKKIHNRSEGWISGIKLASINVMEKDEAEIHRFINDFSGSHSYIIDYLLEEVLAGLDNNTKEFLYKTSIVENLCPGLCNYLTERNDSDKFLKELEKINLFIFPIDLNRQWYRYHRLFRDSLISSLPPSLKNKLHLKAAEWYNEAGFFRNAINEAIKAEDYKLVVEYIINSIPEYLEQGKINVLLKFLELVPEKYIINNGLLLILKSWSLFVTGGTRDALFYLDLIKRRPELINENNKGKSLILESLSALITDTSFKGEDLEDITVNNTHDKLFKLGSLGQIYASQGYLQQAVSTFKEAYYLARETGQNFMEILTLTNYILLLNQTGNLKEALKLCEYNLNRLLDDRNIESIAKLLYIPFGILYYEMANYQKSKEYLKKGIEMSEEQDLVYVFYYSNLYLAKIFFSLGKKEKAIEIIDNIIVFTNHHNMILENKEIENLKREIEFFMNGFILSDEKLNFYEEVCNNDISTVNIKYILTYCRFLFHNSEYEKAIKYLKKIKDFKNNKKIIGERITCNLLLALIYYNYHQEDKAKMFLQESIRIKGSERYITIFVNEGESVLPLISKFRDIAPEFFERVKELVKDVSSDNTSSKSSYDQAKPIDSLTERETEILILVAKGLTNKKIAEKLYITAGTTKWHLSNVYSKLSVNKRTKAVAIAKKLGLIE